MTFEDVPVGHIFRFTECDCMFRRAGTTHGNAYTVVHPCWKHGQGSTFRKYPIAEEVLGFAGLDEQVRYDPLAAMLEEQL